MKRVLSTLLVAALAAGSIPILVSGSGSGAVSPSQASGHGCCGAMSCCEAGPPCAAGARACVASTNPSGSADCSLRALPCGGPSARVTDVTVDPMLRPGPAAGIDAPGPVETVAGVDRHVGGRATEPAVPPPRG